MRRSVWYLILPGIITLLPSSGVFAQEKRMNSLLRIYVDNDFFNIRGRGTDRAYTGGLRFDLFYEKKNKSILVPGARSNRDSSVYMGQWGIMQAAFTPGNISSPYFQPHDYFYSAALFVNHSQFYYNRAKHYSFQTEFQLGIRGPAAFGQQSQTFFHRAIDYTIPKGWDNQLQNAPLVNANFTFEKQIASPGRRIELIAGVKSFLGTFKTGLSIYPLLRVGIMTPYFDGYIGQVSGKPQSGSQKKNKLQAYLIIRPDIQFVLNNALVSGGAFATRPVLKLDDRTSSIGYSNSGIRHCVYSIDYGVIVSKGRFGLSFIQNTSSEWKKSTYSHEFGNVSLYLGL